MGNLKDPNYHDQKSAEPVELMRLEALAAPKSEDGNDNENENENKESPLSHKLSLFLGLFWLAPIVGLLVLNFTNYVVGASFGCPRGGKCVVSPILNNVTETAKLLDKKDHNAIGALQLPAKALEIWFVLIMGTLVWELTRQHAKKRGNNPATRYLTANREYGDPSTFFHGSFWTSARDRKSAGGSFLLYWFPLSVLLICILCTLIGPSAAVLILPTAGWLEIATGKGKVFNQMETSGPPTQQTVPSICTGGGPNIPNGQYGCFWTYKTRLDTMMEGVNAGFGDLAYLSEEGYLTISINTTDLSDLTHIFSTPSRNVTQSIVSDISRYGTAVNAKDYPTALEQLSAANDSMSKYEFSIFRTTLAAQLKRKGPVLSYATSCQLNVSVIQVSDDKFIRCYNIPNPDTQDNLPSIYPISDSSLNISTMCLQNGTGWAGSTNYSQFVIPEYPTTVNGTGDVSVSIFTTARVAYLDSTTYHCATSNQTQSDSLCNWDAIFSTEIAPNMTRSTINQMITEYSNPQHFTTWCQTATTLGFSTYVYDISPWTNPLRLVTLENSSPMSPSDEPIRIHPNWVVAMWAAKTYGTADGTQKAAQIMVSTTKNAVDAGTIKYVSDLHQAFNGMMMSILVYSTTDSSAGLNGTIHPVLTTQFVTRVWSYGFGSRTSKLGFVVVLACCVCVILRAILGWRRTISPPSLETLAQKAKEGGLHVRFPDLKSEVVSLDLS
ncbi:hypothetical protein V502_02939 [Pseudogymnoascus sp. VKM F-4520 (FW-2644)]|nr:hypothetical protein V502_02939 [Pseudogymnoascus sp. VKM F-4520 (FW-2644)]